VTLVDDWDGLVEEVACPRVYHGGQGWACFGPFDPTFTFVRLVATTHLSCMLARKLQESTAGHRM
jgi:hypothetical protein